MGSYIPTTAKEKQEILNKIGINSTDELFGVIPDSIKIDRLNMPEGRSEMEAYCFMEGLAAKNKVFGSIFRGAGAYNHFIPPAVKSITSKEEFVTAYTPYQAEISQGMLQAIFEFQTMICELTGMDVANASVYDGASAAAEAAAMCIDKRRMKVVVSAAANPMAIDTIKTYSFGSGAAVVIVPEKDGKTDIDALKRELSEDTACVYIQQPNFYGQIEDASEIGEIAKSAGAKFIMGVNPIAGAILKTPMECGADIAVGEGQPLGLPLSFGGPYLGFMAATSAMTRKLPGRIVGQTTDKNGKRAFVLTLQAREQHIRREKASSNICSNQALCALTASVYMSCLGANGLKQVAELCLSKAHYAANKISAIKGFELKYKGEFFHEFATKCPIDAGVLLEKLEEHNILGGLPLEDGILWCVTEMNTKEQIDNLCRVIEEVCSL